MDWCPSDAQTITTLLLPSLPSEEFLRYPSPSYRGLRLAVLDKTRLSIVWLQIVKRLYNKFYNIWNQSVLKDGFRKSPTGKYRKTAVAS